MLKIGFNLHKLDNLSKERINNIRSERSRMRGYERSPVSDRSTVNLKSRPALTLMISKADAGIIKRENGEGKQSVDTMQQHRAISLLHLSHVLGSASYPHNMQFCSVIITSSSFESLPEVISCLYKSSLGCIFCVQKLRFFGGHIILHTVVHFVSFSRRSPD